MKIYKNANEVISILQAKLTALSVRSNVTILEDKKHDNSFTRDVIFMIIIPNDKAESVISSMVEIELETEWGIRYVQSKTDIQDGFKNRYITFKAQVNSKV